MELKLLTNIERMDKCGSLFLGKRLSDDVIDTGTFVSLHEKCGELGR